MIFDSWMLRGYSTRRFLLGNFRIAGEHGRGARRDRHSEKNKRKKRDQRVDFIVCRSTCQ
jgi:hypothetical protein